MNADADSITERDYATLAAFRLALRKFAAFSESEAKAAGLSPRQHQALLAIRGTVTADARDMSIGDLAAHLLIRHNSAVELVDRLVDAGFVRRQADPADARRVALALTPQAETLLSGLSAAHLRELKAMRPALVALLETI
jgi:DNA-binding MarR family transcriptional regulator